MNLPGTIGGSEWGGAAYDPETGLLYVKSNDAPEIDLLQKTGAANNSVKLSGYNAGKKIYALYCAGCHKLNREGNDPLYPSLVDLQIRMTKEQVLDKIKQGGGKMPAFSTVLKGQEDAIITFLFNASNKNLSPKEAALLEISENISSHSTFENETKKNDTAVNYLNVSAYAQFEDIDGHPAIKPPWGMLNAINLNTGEYEWRAAVGNNAETAGEKAHQ